jgi:hypothetical protein
VSIWDEVKKAFGEGPRYPARHQFTKWLGYAGGEFKGEFSTALDAEKAGVRTTERVVDDEGFLAARRLYDAHESALMEEWKRRVRAQHPGVNDAVFELVYSKAYEDAHSDGMSEVELYVDDYVGFATSIIKAAKG